VREGNNSLIFKTCLGTVFGCQTPTKREFHKEININIFVNKIGCFLWRTGKEQRAALIGRFDYGKKIVRSENILLNRQKLEPEV
jgi:hypothetical protein